MACSTINFKTTSSKFIQLVFRFNTVAMCYANTLLTAPSSDELWS